MIRRIPLPDTLVVLVAAGIMVRLGFWQLDRLQEKEALLARYASAAGQADAVAWPPPRKTAGGTQPDSVLYRRSRITCSAVIAQTTRSGLNARGEPGLAHVADCRQPDGTRAEVILGWSRDPAPRIWRGGAVSGTIAPGPRLIADPPLAGLAANARPDPADIPNNHLSYAVQWFLFAAIALIIYALALRKRLAGGDARS